MGRWREGGGGETADLANQRSPMADVGGACALTVHMWECYKEIIILNGTCKWGGITAKKQTNSSPCCGHTVFRPPEELVDFST